MATGMNAIRLEAARSLGILKRTEGISALLRASQNTEFFWRVGREALIGTLPSLTFGEHYGALESDVVPNLCRLLKTTCEFRMSSDAEWKLVLLSSLERVGDARAIDLLTRLEQRNTDPLSRGLPVPEKIACVLKVIQERVARETEQSTLLRGSEAPVLPATLLRSYEGTPDTSPEQLLRPSQSEKESENDALG